MLELDTRSRAGSHRLYKGLLRCTESRIRLHADVLLVNSQAPSKSSESSPRSTFYIEIVVCCQDNVISQSMPQYITFKATRYSFYQTDPKTPKWCHVIGLANLRLTFILNDSAVVKSLVLTRGPATIESVELLDLPQPGLRLSFRRPWIGFRWRNQESVESKFQIQASEDFDEIAHFSIFAVNLSCESLDKDLTSGLFSEGLLSEIEETASTGTLRRPQPSGSRAIGLFYSQLNPKKELILDIDGYSICDRPCKTPTTMRPTQHWQHLASTSGLQLCINPQQTLRLVVFRKQVVIDDIPAKTSHLKVWFSPMILALKYRNTKAGKVCRRQLRMPCRQVIAACQFLRLNGVEVCSRTENITTESTRITSHVSSPWPEN